MKTTEKVKNTHMSYSGEPRVVIYLAGIPQLTRREILSQTAWCMSMPAATETLKESTIPFIGMLQCMSDSCKASSVIPL